MSKSKQPPNEDIYWTHDGKQMKVSDMAVPHIVNAIKSLEKRVKLLKEELQQRKQIQRF